MSAVFSPKGNGMKELGTSCDVVIKKKKCVCAFTPPHLVSDAGDSQQVVSCPAQPLPNSPDGAVGATCTPAWHQLQCPAAKCVCVSNCYAEIHSHTTYVDAITQKHKKTYIITHIPGSKHTEINT